MSCNEQQYPLSKNTMDFKMKKALNRFAQQYKKISKLEKVFTKLSTSSTHEDLSKAVVLAKYLLKEKDKAVANFMDLSSELASEAIESNKRETVTSNKSENRNFKSGDATKNKYRYLTDVAVLLIKDYAIAKPHHLNTRECGRGVASTLIEQLRQHFINTSEQKKAFIIKIPSEQTARKHIKLAFAELGFPEYNKLPKPIIGLSDVKTPLL